MRRTKILATLGPASESESILRAMIKAGLDAVRCNFSHGTVEEHRARVEKIRRVASEVGKTVGILADLQGPKIRISKFKKGFVELKSGALFILDAELDVDAGDEHRVGIDYKTLPQDLVAGDILLLDDGRIVFKVQKVEGPQIFCEVEEGGKLSNNKGINKRGGGLSAKALTEKDKIDIQTAASLGVDFIAVSFPRNAADMYEAQQLLLAAGSCAGLIAKIERTEAVEHMDEIMMASDGIMVARGDLAVEIGEECVPVVQKALIQRARELDKFAITATQMMESMITSVTPTRAEVSDVANAVLDGSDAVMTSAETAVGANPVKVIEAMARVIRAVEKHPDSRVSRHRIECHFNRIDEAIAMSAMYAANHLDVKAIIALTESGITPLWMSRIRSHLTIFALTRNASTMGRMTLLRGVVPIAFDATSMPRFEVNRASAEELVKRKIVKDGDLVILTSGDHMGVHGGTNKMKILRIGSIA